jgi:hypothetical protein
MHRDDPEATQKLVSNNFNTYVSIVCFIRVINNFTFVHDRYTEELRKTHGPDTDPRSVPFDVTTAYRAGRGLQHGRYVESHQLSLVINYQVLTLYAFWGLALGDGWSDVSSYSQKSNVTSSVGSQYSQAAMVKELRQTKDLIQQLLQRNYAMEYTMMHVRISTLVVC